MPDSAHTFSSGEDKKRKAKLLNIERQVSAFRMNFSRVKMWVHAPGKMLHNVFLL